VWCMVYGVWSMMYCTCNACGAEPLAPSISQGPWYWMGVCAYVGYQCMRSGVSAYGSVRVCVCGCAYVGVRAWVWVCECVRVYEVCESV
jgi:hypothetical protein